MSDSPRRKLDSFILAHSAFRYPSLTAEISARWFKQKKTETKED